MRVVAIDPGPKSSAFLVWESGVIEAAHLDNLDLRDRIKANNFGGASLLAIEMIACYGMAVGADVFETVRWIGRFEECTRLPVRLVYRKEIKLHLCNSSKAKDPNVRQALIDKYGIVGTTKNPGPLLGISKHLWSALAVADYAVNNP